MAPKVQGLQAGQPEKLHANSDLEPKYMLGIQRDIHADEQGVRWLEMSQAAYYEDAWKEWGHFRGTKMCT